MKIRLLAFASAGDALGANEVEIELPAGSRLADLRRRLDAAHPGLVPLWPRLAVAVDGELSPPDRALHDGAEIALLPPVSGGAPALRPRVGLVEGSIDVEAVVRSVADGGSGATVLFLGTARDRHDGRPVERLTYSGYRPMAEQALARIVGEIETESPGLRLAIVHRLGQVLVGQASVAIVASSPHRAAAFNATRQALERLKAEVPIWKREHYADGDAVWREEEPLVGSAPPATISPFS